MKTTNTRRLLTLALALTIALSLVPAAIAAEALPTNIDAPTNVILSEYTLSGHPAINVTFNKGGAVAKILDLEYGAAENYGVSGINSYLQIDWSIDDPNGWHYVKSWDEAVGALGANQGYNNGEYLRESLYKETTEQRAILNLGAADATELERWSHTLKAGQYDIIDGNMRIDWTKHTLYVRTRFHVQYCPIDGEWDNYINSGWSQTAAYGAGAKPFEPPKSLEAPVISDFKLTDETFNGGPVVSFNLANPQSVKDASAGVASRGELITVTAQVSIGGGEWIDVQLASRNITDGTGKAYLATAQQAVKSDTWVKLRTRYEYHTGTGALILASGWSNTVQFGAPAWGNASDWATAELAKAAELGLIPDTLRGGDLTRPITRAEFAAVSVKVYESLSGVKAIPAVNNPFTDTKDVEVLKAYNLGITTGTSADKFSPDVLLSREQAATMLTRVFKKVSLAGWTIATDGDFTLQYTKPPLFADDALISSYAKDSVYFMVANKIINGTGNNKFSPRAVTPAEQAANYASATREAALLIAVRRVENLDVSNVAVAPPAQSSPSASDSSVSKAIKAGETRNVQFGGYEWRVLTVEGGKALMITEYVIELRAYQERLIDSRDETTWYMWDRSSLRAYLNGEFYGKFSAGEQSIISATALISEPNPLTGQSSGAATTDKIFCLSLSEVLKYFDSPNDMLGYQKVGDGKTQRLWWTRTTGTTSATTIMISDQFGSDYDTKYVGGNPPNGGVRPALWINL
jgi:hypothetical protein